jgi:hypothetical protein
LHSLTHFQIILVNIGNLRSIFSTNMILYSVRIAAISDPKGA